MGTQESSERVDASGFERIDTEWRASLRRAGIYGKWDSEPDREEWRNRGFPCLARRGFAGAWCGYVAIPEGHPLHGSEQDAIDQAIQCHGGVTYSVIGCDNGICHTPEPGESDRPHWIGFDCAHTDDLVPGLVDDAMGLIGWKGAGLRYRPLVWVKTEIHSIVDQLIQLEAKLATAGEET